MAPLKVKINTYFQDNQRPFIDSLSKFYIVVETLFGLNRIPLILKGSRYFYVLTAIVCAYTLTLFFGIIYTTPTLDLVWYMSCIEYLFTTVFSFLSWKRMERYYNEVNKFDSDVGCRPKMTNESLRNVVAMTIFLTLIVLVYSGSLFYDWHIPLFIQTTPFMLIHCLEVYYYGHLLSLLAPRLRLINYYVESTLSSGKMAKMPKCEEFISFKHKDSRNSEMKKLMDLYQIVITSYDFLIEAIKWQHPLEDILMDVSMMAMEMVPLFSPCLFGDRVHNEVRRLRELLASRLYENKLDKSGRSAARALLSLTEARDLSFSLLRMLQIDISLPFKFIGLLVTYLIILLQFEKVINPSSSSNITVTTQIP